MTSEYLYQGEEQTKYFERYPNENDREISTLQEAVLRQNKLNVLVVPAVSIRLKNNTSGITLLNAHAENNRATYPIRVEQRNQLTTFSGEVDLSSATSHIIFRMPKGFRPYTQKRVRCAFTGHNATNEDLLYVIVATNGDVQVESTIDGTGTVFLDNIQYFSRVEV